MSNHFVSNIKIVFCTTSQIVPTHVQYYERIHLLILKLTLFQYRINEIYILQLDHIEQYEIIMRCIKYIKISTTLNDHCYDYFDEVNLKM